MQKKEGLAQLEAALKIAKPIQFKENIALVLKYFDQLVVVGAVAGRNRRVAIVVPAGSAAILGFGDSPDSGQCGDADKQSSDAPAEFHGSGWAV